MKRMKYNFGLLALVRGFLELVSRACPNIFLCILHRVCHGCWCCPALSHSIPIRHRG